MSKSAEALIYGIRSLQRFVDALSAVESPEQVYAFGLTAIQEIFKPNGAFVLLPDSGAEAPRPTAAHKAGSDRLD